jgi:hypothetical protein
VKINGFDAQRFERLVESVRTITTELLELQACTAQRRAVCLLKTPSTLKTKDFSRRLPAR